MRRPSVERNKIKHLFSKRPQRGKS